MKWEARCSIASNKQAFYTLNTVKELEMAGIFAYRCGSCDEIHEGSPSFGFDEPDHYACLTDEQKAVNARITSDFCEITFEDRTDFFIRALLEVPIHGVSEPFLWGVWVSISQKSYERYVETYDAPVEGDGFFGWVCNSIPWYPETRNLASDIYVQTVGLRPLLRLHSGSTDDHPLILDQVNGITAAKAQQIAEFVLHTATAAAT